MSYEFTGTVKTIKPVLTFQSGFAKREAIIRSEEERYPQDVVFEFTRERMNLLDTVKEGDRVTVSFDIRSNESKKTPGSYFVSLNAWRLVKADATAGAPAGGMMPSTPDPVPVIPVDADMGDMPF